MIASAVATISVLATLSFPSALFAERAKTPTLEVILQRLDANLRHYDTGLPSLFCNERVLSQVEPGLPYQNTTTDSIFRLKRTANPDHTTTLVESREINKVNEKLATSKNMEGPSLLSGAFEGGLAVVSANQAVCMDYKLPRNSASRPSEPYIIQFATNLTPRNSSACLLQEKSKGRVFIDPVSMQITHLELVTPHHAITLQDSSHVMGKRTLTVDYAPVLLGSETFWLPSKIIQSAISGDGTFHRIVWSFRATYRNYHKLEVTSRIVPGVGGTPSP